MSSNKFVDIDQFYSWVFTGLLFWSIEGFWHVLDYVCLHSNWSENLCANTHKWCFSVSLIHTLRQVTILSGVKPPTESVLGFWQLCINIANIFRSFRSSKYHLQARIESYAISFWKTKYFNMILQRNYWEKGKQMRNVYIEKTFFARHKYIELQILKTIPRIVNLVSPRYVRQMIAKCNFSSLEIARFDDFQTMNYVILCHPLPISTPMNSPLFRLQFREHRNSRFERGIQPESCKPENKIVRTEIDR